MELYNLQPAPGAVKKSKRIARGQGSGSGGTASRGHKGARSRSGYSNKWGFEGGQTPLQRRLPKRGFKNVNRKEYTPVNLDFLQFIAEKHETSKWDIETMRKIGLISKTEKIKILARGEIKTKVDIVAHKVSEKAKAAIEAAGGSVTLV